MDGVFKGWHWRRIQRKYAHVFQRGRTNVDLKDKWRNIAKQVSVLKYISTSRFTLSHLLRLFFL